ncbi:type I-E CRISPR-associated protein Cse2/CasB [Streptomyces sp. 35G-GA-8]|uniref:type I-E CRISPR-associated protein Cse2/CasB n=1 Tax=Streptomyces sp. 35G-GA-8 TaxID=2939434 RepID=UPI00201F8E0B|nr:type I-E CRISPR-associated protein Cse2/CasB [Streptomyces sp. 35G-GA-8]MCL7381288.1 type I-E CRISPR-associated protein Cse2/CasB [Streptomyces sp. 35G-GA-8]
MTATVSTAATVSAPGTGPRQAPLGPVGAAVHQHINALQRGYLDDRSDAVSTLARLRRGIGCSAGEAPDLWGLIGTEPLYARYERGEVAEEAMCWAEEAAYAAVTLWSLHQQSHRIARMHRRPGPELGSAVRRLHPGPEIDEPTRKRFVRVGTAATPAVLAGRLRDLVLLLRRDTIPLDYALLADQLHTWQQPGGSTSVRRSWGRSYLAVHRPPSVGGMAEAGNSTAEAGQNTPDDPDTTTPEDDTP